MQSIIDFFAVDGPLARSVDGYSQRPQQIEMAMEITKAIVEQSVFVAEAGTGTGKTFAYLVPAMLKGGKTIVSTGTKTLQDQLFNNDIPRIRQALNIPIRIALLKGRANYVCHYHLERARTDGQFVSRQEVHQLRQIDKFCKTSRTGDKAECVAVPETAAIWSMVTSNRENCLGQECPNHAECFVLNARKEALQADLVVVNHHLFFADIALRDEGMTELLPNCHTVVFDEAHQLPEVASLFFGVSLSTQQLIELAKDIRSEGLLEARDCPELQTLSGNLDKSARDLRLSVGVDQSARYSWQQLQSYNEFSPALNHTLNCLNEISALLATQAERSEGLANCYERLLLFVDIIERWLAHEDQELVPWVEVFSTTLHLNSTPLDVAPIFQKIISEHQRAWIFTSATLAVRGQFQHYCQQMGLSEAHTACWDSPFEYGKQAMLFVPTHMPNPNNPGYTEAVVRCMLPILQAMPEGGAFFLCTSLKAMRLTYDLLQTALDAATDVSDGAPPPFTLLMQGEAGKHELLQRFRQHGRAILVGSQSFWEGVDVRGTALSLVVIDKIPFAPPDDPVLAVRLERLSKLGYNGFMEYQLPQAIINVKQGAGRLIRDETDFGVLAICDPRLIDKQYGKYIWRSLPPMRRTRAADEVVAFYHQHYQRLDAARRGASAQSQSQVQSLAAD